jgi:hypothetical protein
MSQSTFAVTAMLTPKQMLEMAFWPEIVSFSFRTKLVNLQQAGQVHPLTTRWQQSIGLDLAHQWATGQGVKIGWGELGDVSSSMFPIHSIDLSRVVEFVSYGSSDDRDSVRHARMVLSVMHSLSLPPGVAPDARFVAVGFCTSGIKLPLSSKTSSALPQ